MSPSSFISLQLYTEPAALSKEPSDPEMLAGFSRSERDRAEWLACREAWRPFPARRPTTAHEPYSLAWFEEVEKRRYTRHGRWIPKLFEFKRHRGDQVLCLGEGLGTDGVQFAKGGASVHYCSPSLECVSLVQRNFELRGLVGQFYRASNQALPIASDSKDVVCLAAMTGSIQPFASLVDEIFRVLKPGGKLLAALPAKYDAHFWKVFWFPWRRLFGNRPEDQTVYSSRRLKRLFENFSDPRIVKRHLRRSDIPHVWRWMLLPLLERIMGRYLVVKTFKPVGAGLTLRAAA